MDMMNKFCYKTDSDSHSYEFQNFLKFNDQLLNFKKFGSSYDCESDLSLGTKLFTMSFYAIYWKDEFFQRHLRVNIVRIEKSAIEMRKVRISAEIDIQKNYLWIFGRLDIHNNQIKKELSNLV